MRWLFPMLGLLVWAGHSYILYAYAGLNTNYAFTDSVVSTGILSLAIWGLLLLVNAYPARIGALLYALVLATLISALCTFTERQLLRLLFNENDDVYQHWLSDSLLVRYLINWFIAGWTATYAAIDKKAAFFESKFKQHSDASNLLREAELYKLRQQLQPHFLFNSLNSISALTMTEPGKAQEMIGKLSDFLRSSVKREAQDQIAIDEEIAYIEAYLSIESVRFGHRLKIIFSKDYKGDVRIPPFLLQPVLENAIKFGLYGKTGNVEITIDITLQSSMLIITITNPYDPQMQMPKGTGFGLEGIRRRLFLLFARNDLLETLPETELFTTVLKIPQLHVQNDID